MFEKELAISRWQLSQFERVVADLDDDVFFSPGLGHDKSPAWIVGHLALAADQGRQALQPEVETSLDSALFGAGTSGRLERSCGLGRDLLCATLRASYEQLHEAAADADFDVLGRPHECELFAATPIETVMDLTAYLLTSHFATHLAQLSICRRAIGRSTLVPDGARGDASTCAL
ncbi:MAG: DinB family protein [Planctomycetales bacterium]|nr:DinB family protein [Planctomycetales bacterium]